MESRLVLDNMITKILLDINVKMSSGLLDMSLEYWRMGIYIWEPAYLW